MRIAPALRLRPPVAFVTIAPTYRISPGHPSMAEWFVAKASELTDGDRRIVTAGRHEIGVFFTGGDYYAYSNTCLHSGGPAREGLLINPVVDLIAPHRRPQGPAFSD